MYSITVNVDGIPTASDIPQGFEDVKWSTYVKALAAEAQDDQVNTTISVLTGIPVRVLEAMQPYDQRFILTQCAFFWNEQPEIIGIPLRFAEKHIGQDTWQNLIDAQEEFKRVHKLGLPDIAAGQLIIKTYTKEVDKDGFTWFHGVDVSQMPVPEALGYWDFFFGSSQIGPNDGKTSTMTHRMNLNRPQGLRSLKRSGGLPRSMRYAKATQQSTMLCYRCQQLKYTRPCCSKKRNGITKRNTND